MCGIGFVINYGEQKLDLDIVNSMWRNMSIRGTDSSGYYFEREDGTRKMMKLPLESKEAIVELEKNKGLKNFRLDGTEKLIMLHTRAQTHGTRWDNNNNMPIFSKNFVMVHNGVIDNDFTSEKYPYMGEVDSEEILASIEINGWQKGIKRLEGSLAVIVKPLSGKSIYLYRHHNPLDIVYDKSANVLYGCSIAEYVPTSREDRIQDMVFAPRSSVVTIGSDILYKVSLHRREVANKGKIETSQRAYEYYRGDKRNRA